MYLEYCIVNDSEVKGVIDAAIKLNIDLGQTDIKFIIDWGQTDFSVTYQNNEYFIRTSTDVMFK